MCAESCLTHHAGSGTVVIGWSTGNGTIVNNLQAPYYPNATIYAPQTPDPASYNSTVSPVQARWGVHAATMWHEV